MVRIECKNLQRKHPVDGDTAERLARAVLAREGEDDCALALIYCGPGRLRALNRDFRGQDSATDILSFSDGEVDDDGLRYLGDIFISPAVAMRHARQFDAPYPQEMGSLVVHGVLHLLGYDHERDDGRMMRRQEELLAELLAGK